MNNIHLNLALRQTQKLILSPQMQQAIKILQLPLMDLRNEIQQEIATNPLLEEKDMKLSESRADDKSRDEIQKEVDFKEEFETLSRLDDEWKDYFRQSNYTKRSSSEEDEQRKFFEDSITIKESLSEHLLNQLSVSAVDPEMKTLCEMVIGNIDNNGYLSLTDEEIAQNANAELDEVEEAIDLIQKFHPLGVGARNLKECLFIQLLRLGQGDSLPAKIINNHLDDLGKRKYPQIAKALKTTPEEIQNAATIIGSLEPKPGRMFTADNNNYIVPDVAIEKKEDGEFEIILNNDYIPRIRISNLYKNLMKDESTPEKTKEYVKEKVKSGMWFIKNIQQRQQTTYNILKVITKVQKEFLNKGVNYMKPLTMHEVAEEIGVHESTVSRALSNKYVQTPQGIFELKFFFASKLETVSGESVSSTNLKNRINQIVKAEDSKKPLSDQQIVKLMQDEGFKLARRTVAKYRKELKILPSNLRKSY